MTKCVKKRRTRRKETGERIELRGVRSEHRARKREVSTSYKQGTESVLKRGWLVNNRLDEQSFF